MFFFSFHFFNESSLRIRAYNNKSNWSHWLTRNKRMKGVRGLRKRVWRSKSYREQYTLNILKGARWRGRKNEKQEGVFIDGRIIGFVVEILGYNITLNYYLMWPMMFTQWLFWFFIWLRQWQQIYIRHKNLI
jgi:hypothetical protein